MGVPIVIKTEVGEEASARISFNLWDYDDTAISSDDITEATMSLYDRDGNVLNSRDGTDISGDLNTAGAFVFILNTADNAMVDTASSMPEIHTLLFKFTGLSGDGNSITVRQAVEFPVVNLLGV